jgi:hypothetical protein
VGKLHYSIDLLIPTCPLVGTKRVIECKTTDISLENLDLDKIHDQPSHLANSLRYIQQLLSYCAFEHTTHGKLIVFYLHGNYGSMPRAYRDWNVTFTRPEVDTMQLLIETTARNMVANGWVPSE